MRALLFIALTLPYCCAAQHRNDSLVTRMARWHAVLAGSDTMTREQVMEDDRNINTRIGNALEAVLSVPGLGDRAIDSLLPNGFVSHVRSADGRLWLFQWDERSGGTFQAVDNVLFFRDAHGAGTAMFTSASEEGDVWTRGGGYDTIHLLDRTDSTVRYVLIGSVVGCSTCCAELITVIELTADGIDLSYPAFPSTDGPVGVPTWCLDARCGDVSRFEYDPRKKVLHYTYTPDDMTPEKADHDLPPVHGSWRYEGKGFVAQ